MEVFKLVGRIAMEGAQAVEKTIQGIGTKADQLGTKMEGVGSRMSTVGQNMAVPFGAAATGIGAALGKAVGVAMDFEAQMDRVGAISGASASQMQQLNDQALQLGASTSKSASEVAVGMENMAAAGFSVNEIIGAMPGVIAAAEASGSDMAVVSDTVASALNGFGLEASQATHIADVLAQTANQSAANINDLQYSFKYAAPVAKNLGVSMEELAAATGIMADVGIRGEQAGTTLRSALLNLASPSKAASEQLNALGIQVTDSSGKMLPFSNIIGQLSNATSGMSNTQKAAALSTIFGTEAVSGMLAVIDAGPAKLNALTQGLVNADGASARTAAQMKDNLKGALQELGGAFETMGITIGNALTPAITAIAGKIQGLATWFNNLSPSMQRVITYSTAVAGAFTALVAGIGVLISVAGSIVTGFGAVAGVFATGTTGAGLLASAFTLITGPVGIAVASIAGLTAAGVLLYKNWDTIKNHPLVKGTIFGTLMTAMEQVKGMFTSAIPPVNLFGDNVSKATQKSVQGLVDLSTKGTTQLNYLSTSGTTISQGMATKLTGIYNQMSTSVVQALERQKTQGLQKQTEFFNQSSVLSTQREAQIIAKTQESYNQQIQKTQEGNTRINQIIQNAANEHRTITTAEKDEINRIKNEMVTTGIQAMSKNETETKVILERMKQNNSAMNAQMAADTVQQSIKARDGAIKSANETYDQKIAKIIQMRDQTGVISAEEANKMIQEATRQKNDTISKAKEMHSQVVSEAKSQANEHVNQVNWQTGQVKTKWQQMRDDIVKKATDIKTNATNKFNEIKTNVTNKISELRTNATNRFNSLKADATRIFNQAKTAMTNPINEAKTNIGNAIDRIKGFFSGLKGKLGISIPRNISTPHFKVKRWSANPANWVKNGPPYIDIEWYKRGGFMDSTTILGNLGMGEAGAEGIVPLEGKHMLPMAKAISDYLGDWLPEPQSTGLENASIEVPLVVNGREIARAIVSNIDTELKRQQTIKRRGL